jgi:hypothetical protein
MKANSQAKAALPPPSIQPFPLLAKIWQSEIPNQNIKK